MEIKTKIKVTNFKLAACICFTGIFLTGSVIFRCAIYKNDALANYSLLLFIGMFFIWILRRKSCEDLSKRKYDTVQLCMFLFTCVIAFICFDLTNSWNNKKMLFFTIIIPAGMVSYRFTNKKDFLDVFSSWLFFLRLCVVLMFLPQIIDMFTAHSCSYFIARFTNIASLIKQAANMRSITYMGHPLFITEIYLIYYFSEHIFNRMNGKRDSFYVFLIPLIGIALTRSKMGIICIVTLYLLFNKGWKKINKVISLLLVLVSGYLLGFFDGIIERFINSIVNGDITTGRNTMLIRYINNKNLVFHWIKGQSISESVISNKIVVALEYPILRWAYTMGIIIAVLLTILVIIYPLAILAKRKQWELFGAAAIIFAQVNSYSGIGDAGNKPAIFYIVCCLILNASNFMIVKSDVLTKEIC